MRPASRTALIRRTTTLPTCATACAASCCRSSRSCGRERSTASVSSRDLAADDDALLDELAAAELARRTAPDGGIDWHDPPGPALGRRIIRIAVGDPAASAERVEALIEAAAGVRGGVRIELGGGRVASVKGRIIRIA